MCNGMWQTLLPIGFLLATVCGTISLVVRSSRLAVRCVVNIFLFSLFSYSLGPPTSCGSYQGRCTLSAFPQRSSLSEPSYWAPDINVAPHGQAGPDRQNRPGEVHLCVHFCPCLLIIATLFPQLENARAAVDLYRSASAECEGEIASGKWPFALPPANFARCYL
jgi:hypothetical protein